MKSFNFKALIAKILIISIIFSFASFRTTSFVLADEKNTPVVTADMREEIKTWINNWVLKNEEPIIRHEYDEDGEPRKLYTISMPNGQGNIVYDASSGKYIYRIKDENENVVDQIHFDINVAMTENLQASLPDLTANNYKNYIEGQENAVLETDKGEHLKILNIDSDVKRNMAYVIEFDNGEDPVFSGTQQVEPGADNQSLWDKIVNVFLGAIGYVKDLLTGIFNELFLWIADGIQSLIDGIFGSNEHLTVYKVIFGKIDKLSINFWQKPDNSNVSSTSDPATSGSTMDKNENPSGIVDNAPAPTLKNIVSYWYGVFRAIVIVVYLVMLLYIGIRILLSSTGKTAEKYKSMLSSWVVGIVILFFFPYVMRYIIIVNDSLVGMVDSQSAPDNNDAMLAIREDAEEDRNITLTFIYIIMLGQLIVLLGVYYKRIFTLAFLITIFPIVAGLYIWEKTNRGSASALTAWTKEYVVLVLIQSFHAVIYSLLIEGAYIAFKTPNNGGNYGNWFVFVLSVMFLFKAEKIIRTIFDMKSSANTIGDLASAGAAAWATSKAVGGIFKGGDKSKSKDEEEQKEADEEVKNATHQQQVYNIQATKNAGNETNASSSANSSATTGSDDTGDELDNLHAAQALVKQQALKKKTKRGIGSRIVNGMIGGTARAAGITLGITSGLAAGDLKQGFANAVIANEITGAIAKVPKSIIGYAKGAFAGQRLKAKIKSGAMDEQFKEVGLDLSVMDSAKAKIIRDALAAQAAATRRVGAQKGELRFVKVVEKGRKKEKM